MAVPQVDSVFDSYMSTTQTYLNTASGGIFNYVRLGVTPAERNTLENYALTLWPNIWHSVNNPTLRTPALVEQKDDLKEEITNFITPLLFRMAGSASVTPTDKLVLKLPSVTRTRKKRPAIETAPNSSMSPLEGATILVSNRVDKSEKRDKMHPDCDAIEMVFKVGGNPPVTPLECPQTFMSSKARFIFQGGMANDGEKLYAYTRWVNLADASKNGPWGTLVMATISAGTPKVVVV